MDIVTIVSERKIAEGIEEGLFDALPPRGRIDCSLQGAAFVAQWWREKLAREKRFGESSDARVMP